MKSKPVFRPSFGNKPDKLVGRAEIIETITEGLEKYPGSFERATLLVGQRGMGSFSNLPFSCSQVSIPVVVLKIL